MTRTALATSGGPGPEELNKWIARRFSVAQARGWIADGVPLEEAEAWRAIGMAEAEEALRWRVRGVSPGQARLLGFDTPRRRR